MSTNLALETRRLITDSGETITRLRGQLEYAADFDFFGVPTRIWVGSEVEAGQWRHFYKYFVATVEQPVIEVYLEIEGHPEQSFIASIFRKDFVPKAIWVREGGRLILWSRFDRWSSIATPLPPFMFPPLSHSLTLFNASSVIAPGTERGVVFMAPPYQGKSTLMNAIVQRGGRPLADNITVTRHGGCEILPYLTPTGVREETVQQLPHVQAAVAALPSNWVTVSEVTGKVYLLHVDAIHEFEAPTPVPPALFVFPVDDRDGKGRDHALAPLSATELRVRLGSQRLGLTQPPLHELDSLAQRVPAVELRYSLLRSDLDRVVDDVLAQLR